MADEAGAAEETVLLECNLDDMTPEALGYCLEQLLAAGALDAWFTPIYMKKSRPAVMLSVLCVPAQQEPLTELLLRETTTLGVRHRPCGRRVAQRRTEWVRTPWGLVRRKVKVLDGREVGAKPEYDDCARLARDHHVPLQEVVEAARRSNEIVGERMAQDEQGAAALRR